MRFYSSEVQEFLNIENDLDRFDFLCDLAFHEKGLDAEQKTNNTRIAACDSMLWAVMEIHEGKLQINVDSDSIYVKGLALLFSCELKAMSWRAIKEEGSNLPLLLYSRGIIEEKRMHGLLEIQNKARSLISYSY